MIRVVMSCPVQSCSVSRIGSCDSCAAAGACAVSASAPKSADAARMRRIIANLPCLGLGLRGPADGSS